MKSLKKMSKTSIILLMALTVVSVALAQEIARKTVPVTFTITAHGGIGLFSDDLSTIPVDSFPVGTIPYLGSVSTGNASSPIFAYSLNVKNIGNKPIAVVWFYYHFVDANGGINTVKLTFQNPYNGTMSLAVGEKKYTTFIFTDLGAGAGAGSGTIDIVGVDA
jgi:uncharacterized protein affecting Mg2+/Co2+ transport